MSRLDMLPLLAIDEGTPSFVVADRLGAWLGSGQPSPRSSQLFAVDG
jgi:hypothetical protein